MKEEKDLSHAFILAIINKSENFLFSEGKGVMDYFQTLGDLKDTRVLLTFVNSLYEDVFTPDIMLNDKWSVNLALEAISNILRIKSDFDSEVRGHTGGNI